MATPLTQTHPLLSIPFSAATDFTELAGYCELCAETLLESDDPALRMALCGRLSACIALLKSTLNDPVPHHLAESLTVDILPPVSLDFDPDSELLCDYSLAVAELITGGSLSRERERTLTGLLAELVCYFAADLKAPRWIRTPDGVRCIGEVAA
ncbi:hypothetical protein [Sodalis ligni]|uniref:Uncharacterized protein n=1 Tax=Sodalis ligni TaxID=2697027 RepID=A0A4R1NH18_9GAMM|nr:hypothetical protein [Sodalis ligni]TCL06279.1 hypothetical protein EZJ58_4520 [Sodalis ligni]